MLKKRGFTLLELLIVIAIIAALSGSVVLVMDNAVSSNEQTLVAAELSRIREAVLRFKKDMGEPPQFIAELLQAPDPADTNFGGWWWRKNSGHTGAIATLPNLPIARLYTFDSATGRGWNGPYLQVEFASKTGEEVRETQLDATGTKISINSDAANADKQVVTLLKAQYSTINQAKLLPSGRLLSHYQFDFSNPAEIKLRFVSDPTAATIEILKEIGLGIKP